MCLAKECIERVLYLWRFCSVFSHWSVEGYEQVLCDVSDLLNSASWKKFKIMLWTCLATVYCLELHWLFRQLKIIAEEHIPSLSFKNFNGGYRDSALRKLNQPQCVWGFSVHGCHKILFSEQYCINRFFYATWCNLFKNSIEIFWQSRDS